MSSSLPPPSIDTPPARRRSKETRPQELLDAALALFVEKGFAATRSEEVAHRAGVSKGTLYLYYASKAELFKALVRTNMSALIAEGAEVAEAFDGPRADLLSKLITTWWERVGNTPIAGLHKVVLSEARNFPEIAAFYTEEVIVPADRLFAGIVQQGIDRGEFRELPVHEVAHAFITPVIFAAIHRHSFGACPAAEDSLDSSAVVLTHLDLLLRGLVRQTPVKRSRPSVSAT